MHSPLTRCAVLAAGVVALAACGGDDPIAVDGAWARTSPMGTDRGAVYFDITSEDADTLVGVSVSSSVAGAAEIHEMVAMAMDDMDDDMGSDDMDMSDDVGDGEMPMAMQEIVGGLPLPAGELVTLEPGGLHVMLLDLVEPLVTGEALEVTLDFENADDVTIEVPISETAP